MVNCSHINEIDIRLLNFSIRTSVDQVRVLLLRSACRGQQRSASRGQQRSACRGQPVEVSRGQLLEVSSARGQLNQRSARLGVTTYDL